MRNSGPETTAEFGTVALSLSGIWAPKLVTSLIACVTGGVIGGALIHTTNPFFQLADLPEVVPASPPELAKQRQDALVAYLANNYAFSFGLLGACLGLSIGTLATTKRRLASGLAGGVGGSLGGAAAGFVIGNLIAKSVIQSTEQSFLQNSIFHFALWAFLVSSALLMVGYIQDGWLSALNCAGVGIVLGLAVAVAYIIVSSAFIANSNLLLLLPHSGLTRIVWISTSSIVLGLGLHFGLRERKSAFLARISLHPKLRR